MTLGDDKSGINGVVRSHLTMSSLSPRPRPRGISRVISGRASRTGVTRSRRNEDFFSSWKSKASTQLSYPLAFFSLPFLFHFFFIYFFLFPPFFPPVAPPFSFSPSPSSSSRVKKFSIPLLIPLPPFSLPQLFALPFIPLFVFLISSLFLF